jgi:DNA-binding IclR family transcriptional regulator
MSEITNANDTDATTSYNVPALDRGLRLLMEFNRHEQTLTPPELARRLGLPRSTVFRMLATLEGLGFVERTDGDRAYKLGIAVLRLGFEYLSSLDLTELGTPILGRLRDQVGYACNLVVRDKRSVIYVAKVTPAAWIASSVTVGTRLPAHATVFGRLLLADMSLEQLRELYPEDHLEKYTEQTPRTTLALFDLIEADRDNDCVVGEGFYERSISTVGAVVRNAQGDIAAALGITVPYSKIEPALRESLVTHITQAAHELSAALGYLPSHRADATVVRIA